MSAADLGKLKSKPPVSADEALPCPRNSTSDACAASC